jgi:hypothetical protein
MKQFWMISFLFAFAFSQNKTEIRFNIPIEGEIKTLKDVDAYSFSALQGDRVTIRLKPYVDCFHRLELTNANDSVIASNDVAGMGLNSIEDFIIPGSGAYAIRVKDYKSSSVFKYTIGLFSPRYRHGIKATLPKGLFSPRYWHGIEAAALFKNSVLTDSINPPISMNFYLFESTSWDKITIRLKPKTSCSHRIEVIDPSGIVIVSNDRAGIEINSIDDFMLPTSGIYTIRVSEYRGANNFSYSIGLYSRQCTLECGDTLYFNNVITDSIHSSVDINSYLFSGIPGDKISIRLKPDIPCCHGLELINPSGGVIASKNVVGPGLNSIDDLMVPIKGTYIVKIREYTGSTNFQYSLGLYSWNYALAASDTIRLNSELIDSICPTIAMNTFLFSGTEGEKITVRLRPAILKAFCYPRIDLIDPCSRDVKSNEELLSGYSSKEDFIIPLTGVYLIRIRENTGSCNFKYNVGLYPR